MISIARASCRSIGTEIEFSSPENPNSGELAMWGSVLLRAKSDLDFKFWSRVAMRARAWFNSTRTDPGSFLFVCTITGLDPDAVRERLKEKL